MEMEDTGTSPPDLNPPTLPKKDIEIAVSDLSSPEVVENDYQEPSVGDSLPLNSQQPTTTSDTTAGPKSHRQRKDSTLFNFYAGAVGVRRNTVSKPPTFLEKNIQQALAKTVQDDLAKHRMKKHRHKRKHLNQHRQTRSHGKTTTLVEPESSILPPTKTESVTTSGGHENEQNTRASEQLKTTTSEELKTTTNEQLKTTTNEQIISDTYASENATETRSTFRS
eukprot:g1771.t1